MAVPASNLIEELVPRSETRVVAGLIAFTISLRLTLFFAGYVQTEIHRAGSDIQAVEPSRAGAIETLDRLYFADPGWYMSIAVGGYARRPFTTERFENWGFFPVWPIAMRLFAPILGGAGPAGLILANLASLAAIVLLFRLLRLDHSIGVCTVATAAFVSYPWAYHLMRPGSEGIFVLSSFASLLAQRRQRHWLAGFAGALAVLSRPPGIFLFPMLALIAADSARKDPTPWRTFLRDLVPLLLLPAALLGFMLYMYRLTGNAFAYFDIQRVMWGQHGQIPLFALGAWLRHPAVTGIYGWDLTLLSGLTGIAVLALVAAGAWLQSQGQLRMRPEYWLYLGLSLLMIFSRTFLGGVGRYLLPVFPLFLLLTLVFTRRPAALLAIGAGFLVLQSFLCTNLLAYQTWAG
jgi:hypothetical protein